MMSLKGGFANTMLLKDSLSGGLVPVRPREVSIYACGITPYSSAHVGHARTYVVFDLLAKVLTAQGHAVRLVRNITDIDDKIIAAAQAKQTSWQALSEHYAQENRELMVATGLDVPEEPKASEYLKDIFELTQALLDKGLAYQASNGDVLYRVAAYTGALLMQHKEGSLRSEQGVSRVDASAKEDLRDFALWKRTPQDTPGFDSPWGYGRPGWHIECSAMIGALFGGSVTIHGGGVDLKFPHHQSEIMQSEPVFGRPLADLWMHNGSVLNAGQKMSKSTGNFVTWQDALNKAEELAPGLGSQLLRMALLQAHWQKPLDWSERLLQATKADLVQLSQGLHAAKGDSAAFLTQLSFNLNTPRAFTWLKQQHKEGRLAQVAGALSFLGVDTDAWAVLAQPAPTLDVDQIAQLQAQRQQARAAHNWVLADDLREQLRAHGVDVQDNASR